MVYIERFIQDKIIEISKYFPVIFITGPRQSGKTTLVKYLFKELPYVLFENLEMRTLALEDPKFFLQQYSQGAVLDEVQNVPSLFSYLQGEVDENPNKKFILTGSQNFLLNQQISQSLAGRVGVLSLLPHTFDELKDHYSDSSVFSWIYKGSYPRLYQNAIPPDIFYSSYTQTYLERDVRQLSNIGNLSLFSKFLTLCAARIGQIFNYSSVATEIGVSVNTLKKWLSILEASYVLFGLSPYYSNIKKRMIKSPKIYFYDTGLACYLLNIRNQKDLETHYLKGSLFENWVILEVLKSQLNQGEKPNLFYLRDSHGHEIDLIIPQNKGFTAIEIKAGMTYHLSFSKSIEFWSGVSGIQLNKKYVVYTGLETLHTQTATLIPWNQLHVL